MTRLALLIELAKLIPELTLTGSYAFGHATSHSDIDVFAMDTEQNLNALDSLGFLIKSETTYVDTLTCSVWSKLGIDVQLVSDFDLKCRVQQFLRDCPTMSVKHTKSRMKEYWNWAISVVS